MHTVMALGTASPMSALARSLGGWAVLCLGVGMSITLTKLAGPSADLGPLAVRAVQAVIAGVIVIPPIMILRRRLGEGSRRPRRRPTLTWIRPAAIATGIGVVTAAATWAPAIWAGWVRVGSVSVQQLLVFLAVNTLIALLYEAIPEELALRGYAWDSMRQRFEPIIAAAVVTVLFCATYTGISAVQTGSALLLGVGADGIRPSPDGIDPFSYFLQLSLFGLTLIAARSLPVPGAVAAAVSFHLVHLTVNRLLFGGLGGFDTGVEASVAPDASILVLVHIILSGFVFAVLRKTLRTQSGTRSRDRKGDERIGSRT
jgi:membrane protease YdiL (CAAX protease family)